MASAAAASRAAEPAVGPVLLATKLHVPVGRRRLVPRPGLLARLSDSPLRKLTLVDAPPGFGKTTILAHWAARERDRRRFGWVSLDPADNDPARFWAYVVEAARTAAPSVGGTAAPLLRASGAAAVDVVLGMLVNELAELSDEVVLVLDDYHLVTNREVHERVGELLKHLPETLRLVLATRADPPLPLARLRASGELLELRAADLRFTSEEAEAFLNGVLGLRLDLDAVGLLQQRTEGWAAGLYLAALSLSGRRDRRAFIDAFAGDDRHVVDYLVTEVLERQPDEVREFLLGTSLLDRLSAPLCDAVLARSDSARMLDELERSNLFLVPLDTTREWYRYHHLFADLLRHELQRTDADLVPTLHRRASAWHREHGSVSEAIRHAAAAGDVAVAADLIALHWNDYVNGGRSETVAAWLAPLPHDVVGADARLCLAKAGSSLTLGRRDEVEPWLDAAERAPAVGSVRVGGASIEAEAAIYRAVHLYMVGDFTRARAAAGRAASLEQADTSPWRAMSAAALGRSLFWCGDLEEAKAALEDAVRHRRGASNNLSVIGALGYLAAIAAERGEAHEGIQLADEAIRVSEAEALAEHWVALPAFVARAGALRELGDRERALSEAERAVALGRRGAGRVEMAYALLALAEIQRRQDRLPDARAAVAEARRAVEECPDPGMLGAILARVEQRLHPGRRADEPSDDELSARELAVLELFPTGRSLREIGAALYLSQNTVKTHTRNIYRKLSASTRDEAIARARELGVL